MKASNGSLPNSRAMSAPDSAAEAPAPPSLPVRVGCPGALSGKPAVGMGIGGSGAFELRRALEQRLIPDIPPRRDFRQRQRRRRRIVDAPRDLPRQPVAPQQAGDEIEAADRRRRPRPGRARWRDRCDEIAWTRGGQRRAGERQHAQVKPARPRRRQRGEESRRDRPVELDRRVGAGDRLRFRRWGRRGLRSGGGRRRRAGVGRACRQVFFGLGDRRGAGLGDLEPLLASRAARADQRLLAAALLGVVRAAASGAEQPSENPSSSAARCLNLAAAQLDLGPRQFVAGHRLAVRGNEYRLPVREQPRERVAAHAGPVAHRSAVDMHPGRRAGRVESHAPRLHAHRDVTDARRADVDEMGVDRLAFHMLGILGDLMRAAAKHGVGPRRTVAGQNVDRLRRTQLAVDLPDDVEEVRVHFCRLVEPPIAHEPVQLVEDRGIVNAIHHVGE